MTVKELTAILSSLPPEWQNADAMFSDTSDNPGDTPYFAVEQVALVPGKDGNVPCVVIGFPR